MNAPRRRRDIQGLRALAVTLVVVFHLVPAALPGGYIGVDVFFVISGFLITGHLLREVDRTGRVRVLAFWGRRVRRLLPAAFLVLLVSAALTALCMPAAVREQNFLEIAFAGIYGLNWLLAGNSVDYLAADNQPSLVQHYWSLSVEEQFYIAWPLLIVLVLWLCAKLPLAARKAAIAWALVVVFGVSLAYSVIETARSQPSAYFVTTTRAWEFAAGALLVFAPQLRLAPWLRAALAWIAGAAVLASAVLLTGASPFPGWIAIVPVCGAAALIWLGDSTVSWSPQRLSHAVPVQFIGDTSYAIYLWHWPLIVVMTAQLGRAPGWIWGVGIALVTVLLAFLTKRYVEDPVIRAPGALQRTGVTFAGMAIGIALVLAASVTPVLVQQGAARAQATSIDDRTADTAGCFGAYAVLNECADPFVVPADLDVAYAAADSYQNWMREQPECEDSPVGALSQTVCESPGGGTGVVLIGDSHAKQYVRPMLEIAERQDWNFRMIALTGCSGLEPPEVWNRNEKQLACLGWGEQLHQDLLTDPSVTTVIVTANTMVQPEFEAFASERLRDYIAAGKQVVVIRDAPGLARAGMDVVPDTPMTAPECVESAGPLAADPCGWQPLAANDWLMHAAQQAGAEVVDPRQLVCSADGTCHAIIGGVVVYFDDDHLSQTFLRTMTPWLEDQLVAIIPAR